MCMLVCVYTCDCFCVNKQNPGSHFCLKRSGKHQCAVCIVKSQVLYEHMGDVWNVQACFWYLWSASFCSIQQSPIIELSHYSALIFTYSSFICGLSHSYSIICLPPSRSHHRTVHSFMLECVCVCVCKNSMCHAYSLVC